MDAWQRFGLFLVSQRCFAMKLSALALSLFALLAVSAAAALADDCGCTAPVSAPVVVQQPPTSWIYMRSRFSHDPASGVRVAQYSAKPPIEPLDDPRLVTSGYSRSRTVIRGADGTVDTYYRVTNYGNGRGGLDAEWVRFHDARRGFGYGGGYSPGAYGPYGAGYGGYGGYGYGYPGFGGGLGGGFGGGVGFPGGAAGSPWSVPSLQTQRSYGPLGLGGGYGYGPGYGVPDAGRLDPDAADGYREQIPREPDREFFNRDVPGAAP